jgi:hypothetical protein
MEKLTLKFCNVISNFFYIKVNTAHSVTRYTGICAHINNVYLHLIFILSTVNKSTSIPNKFITAKFIFQQCRLHTAECNEQAIPLYLNVQVLKKLK